MLALGGAAGVVHRLHADEWEVVRTMDIYAHFIAQNDRAAANTIGGILGEAVDKPAATEKPTLSDADKAAIAQRIADGASLEAAISAVRPDVSVLDLLGI